MAANITNMQPYIAAGIDPKTRLPRKYKTQTSQLKEDTKKFLRLVDEQQATQRYKWKNIPCNITSAELERMLYYKGQLCFFYDKVLDEFYFMPYALTSEDGTGLDFYGRFRSVHPVPISTPGTEAYKRQFNYLSTLVLNCQYGLVMPEERDVYNSCVLLHDYTKQISQTIIPRAEINDPILDTMSECIPYMQTSMILATGINGIRVNDADQEDAVKEGSRGLRDAALSQTPWIPLLGTVEFQQLTPGAVGKAEEYMMAMQSLDNLRLSGYGIQSGGLFQKKAHELQSESDMNAGPVGLVLEQGLAIRKNFCDIVNSIWGVGIDVSIATETKTNAPQENTQEDDQEEYQEQEGDQQDETNV